MKITRLICGLLAIAVLDCCTACTTDEAAVNSPSSIPSHESEKAEFDACLIEKTDDDLLYIYLNYGGRDDFCILPVDQNTAFLSHDSNIRQLQDVKPGMMFRMVVPDSYKTLLYPGSFSTALSIETWGEHREDLYRAGLDCLHELQGDREM
ncbi:MAG: hypothetical protein HFE86_02735 [Clostridiales bacterium]|nr:hypothetical protein [Clostridiales bacterium]